MSAKPSMTLSGCSGNGALTAMMVGCAMLLCLAAPRKDAVAESTTEILRRADEARGNLSGMEWEILVSSLEKGRQSEMVFDVKARGFDIRAVTLSPPKDKGNTVLMLSGNMWFYKPGLSKPVPISQRQKLLGNAAYGDIAATNYADDYEAHLLGEEGDGSEACYVYDLKARSNKVTYDKIKYWISKERFVGTKAEYLTVSGKTIKRATMEYENHVDIAGIKRPFISRIRIQDALLTTDQTTLTFSKTNMRAIPDHVFNLNLLAK